MTLLVGQFKKFYCVTSQIFFPFVTSFYLLFFFHTRLPLSSSNDFCCIFFFQFCTLWRFSPSFLAVVLLVFLSPALCHYCHCDSGGSSGALKFLGAHQSGRWLHFNLARLSGIPQHQFWFFFLRVLISFGVGWESLLRKPHSHRHLILTVVCGLIL